MEKRQYHRWHCSVACEFASGSERGLGTVTNLSFNGARIEDASQVPAVESRIELSLASGDHRVPIAARVIYACDDFFGLVFEESREDTMRKLMPFFQRVVDQGGLDAPLPTG